MYTPGTLAYDTAEHGLPTPNEAPATLWGDAVDQFAHLLVPPNRLAYGSTGPTTRRPWHPVYVEYSTCRTHGQHVIFCYLRPGELECCLAPSLRH